VQVEEVQDLLANIKIGDEEEVCLEEETDEEDDDFDGSEDEGSDDEVFE